MEDGKHVSVLELASFYLLPYVGFLYFGSFPMVDSLRQANNSLNSRVWLSQHTVCFS